MSGTPEYYFAKRWQGIERLGELIGDKPISSKRTSIELSNSEEISDIIEVTEKFLHFSDEVRNALFEKKLSENELVKEIRVLDDRIKWAANILQDASVEINRALNRILTSNTNVHASRLLEDIPLGQKK